MDTLYFVVPENEFGFCKWTKNFYHSATIIASCFHFLASHSLSVAPSCLHPHHLSKLCPSSHIFSVATSPAISLAQAYRLPVPALSAHVSWLCTECPASLLETVSSSHTLLQACGIVPPPFFVLVSSERKPSLRFTLYTPKSAPHTVFSWSSIKSFHSLYDRSQVTSGCSPQLQQFSHKILSFSGCGAVVQGSLWWGGWVSVSKIFS